MENRLKHHSKDKASKSFRFSCLETSKQVLYTARQMQPALTATLILAINQVAIHIKGLDTSMGQSILFDSQNHNPKLPAGLAHINAALPGR